MSLRKLLPSLNFHSSPSTSPNTPAINHEKPPSRPAKGAPLDLGMEDLLTKHLQQRALRMFTAEEAETMQAIEARAHDAAPNPSPRSVATFPPPPTPAQSRSQNHEQRTVRETLTSASNALQSRTGSSQLAPHLHPMANMRPDYDPLIGMARNDRFVRTTALRSVSAIMRDQSLRPRAAAMAMKDVRDACRNAGVPFSELLEENLDGLSMTPLVLEIARCDFQRAPELLLFLLENSHSRNVLWSIRRGCMLRTKDDNLYETLRHLVPLPSTEPWDPPPFEYEVSIQQEAHFSNNHSAPGGSSAVPNEFRALISIPDFPSALLKDAAALAKRRSTPPEKRGERCGPGVNTLLRAEAGLMVEFTACKRCWTLEIGSNRLTLTLVDGEECNIDARMMVIKEEKPVLPKLKIAPIPGITKPQSSRIAPSGPSSTLPLPDGRTSDVVFHVQPPTPIATGRTGITGQGAFFSEPASMTSRPTVLPARPPRAPQALIFPRTSLFPLQSKGPHKAVLAPCFPPYASTTNFVKAALSTKELLVELYVRIGTVDEEGTLSPRRASVGGRSFMRDETGSDSEHSRSGRGKSPMGSVFEEDDDEPPQPPPPRHPPASRPLPHLPPVRGRSDPDPSDLSTRSSSYHL